MLVAFILQTSITPATDHGKLRGSPDPMSFTRRSFQRFPLRLHFESLLGFAVVGMFLGFWVLLNF